MWAVDQPRTGDPRLDCQRFGRGDVIVACPDGWAWSHAERTHPGWLVVKVPGMTLAEATALTSPEPAAGPKQRGPATRYRHRTLFRLDADALFGAYPGRRAAEVVSVPLAAARAAAVRKPPVLDPAVLGSQKPSYVLG